MKPTTLSKLTRLALKALKWLIIVIAALVILCFFERIIFTYYSNLEQFKQSISHVKWMFLFLHLLIIGAITWVWPYYIDAILTRHYLKKDKPITQEELESQQWLKSRWIVLAGLISIEVLLNIGRIIALF